MNQPACASAHRARVGANDALSLPVAWAALCGLLAANMRPEGLDWLRLAAAWLVADGVLGIVWGQLATLKTLEAESAAQPAAGAERRWALPYAEPGSRGRLLGGWLARHAAHTEWANAAGFALTASLLALVVTTFLGPAPLLVAAGALLAIGLGTLVIGDPITLGHLGRGLQVAAGWLLVRVTAAPWQPGAWLPALCVGAWVCVDPGVQRASRHSWRWLARLPWAAAVALLLTQRQALAATAVALGAFGAELAVRPDGRAQPVALQTAWLVSTLLLALSTRYWV